ncbi:MAG: LolA family protein [Cyclobacteriaceae bacterium]
MRKVLYLTIIILATATAGKAQYDAKAMEILDQMSEKYTKMTAYKADFTHSMTNETENINEEFKGEITVKGEKFRLQMSGQEIYSNGSTVWTYLPEVNEVNIDNYYPASDMSPSKIYTAYRDGYKYIYLEDVVEKGHKLQVVDLVPEDNANQFYKIRLKINKDNKNLHSWEIFDKAGNKYLYRITNFTPNVSVGDSFFEFDTKNHKGVEVIDLR